MGTVKIIKEIIFLFLPKPHSHKTMTYKLDYPKLSNHHLTSIPYRHPTLAYHYQDNPIFPPTSYLPLPKYSNIPDTSKTNNLVLNPVVNDL